MNLAKHLTTSAALLAASLLLPGCISHGKMPAVSETQVGLAGNNYKIIKLGATGRSTGFSILGIPFRCSTLAEAKKGLYASVGEPLAGRPVALAHQTEDQSFKWWILFSTDQITLTAEVVEFTDKPGAK
jgi:hypothetical protein